MDLKPGDKVRCINPPESKILLHGGIYTVLKVYDSCNPPRVVIKEYPGDGFYSYRFELANPIPNDPEYF